VRSPRSLRPEHRGGAPIRLQRAAIAFMEYEAEPRHMGLGNYELALRLKAGPRGPPILRRWLPAP